MSFDGRGHGVGALGVRYTHLPNAHAISDGLSAGLRQAYAAARVARLIGMQSFATIVQEQESWFANFNNSLVTATNPAYLGLWDVTIPPWATGILGVALFALVHAQEIEVSHQVQVTRGMDTDTGTLATIPLSEPNTSALRTGDNSREDLHMQFAQGEVSFINVTPGANCIVSVGGHAEVSEDGTAYSYRPVAAAAWYLTVG